MGKRLITQRRGRGTPRYRAKSHRCKGLITYPQSQEKIQGQVLEIIHDPIRSAPIIKILLEDFKDIKLIAPEGIRTGEWIEINSKSVKGGNILSLSDIPEGTEVYNLELKPGDGGKIVRASGTFASIISHDKKTNLTQVRLPSKKVMPFNSGSRATIGRVGGGGKKEKPMARAGQQYHASRAKGKLYPTVCGRAMNATDHPHGGGRHPHVGKSTTVSRDAPPGRKVGHIAARRTGRRKR